MSSSREFHLPLLSAATGEAQSLDFSASVAGARAAGRRGLAVVFWSAVCSHCRRYDDYLRGFAGRHQDLDLVVIACRRGESAADLAVAAQQRHLDFTLAHDHDSAAAAGWGVQQTPTVFLLGIDGALVYRGAIDDFSYPGTAGHQAYLEQAIASFRAGEPVQLTATAPFGCPTSSVYYQLPSVIRQEHEE